MDNIDFKRSIIKHIIGAVVGFGLFLILSHSLVNNYFGKVEGYFFPVANITSFKVVPSNENYFDINKNELTVLSGHLHKKRDCNFVQVDVYLLDNEGRSIPVAMYSLEPEKIRKPGDHVWGPWIIKVGFEDLTHLNLC